MGARAKWKGKERRIQEEKIHQTEQIEQENNQDHVCLSVSSNYKYVIS